MNYANVCQRVIRNGEPGFAWLDNARNYSRMVDPIDYRDVRASGGNPCLEQTLESYELCCLVETFPNNHQSLEDFLETLQCAFLYAKTVTLGKTHWQESNQVMLRNRRIGTSLSGVAQFISKRGLNELKRWCESGYKAIQEVDKRYFLLYVSNLIITQCFGMALYPEIDKDDDHKAKRNCLTISWFYTRYALSRKSILYQKSSIGQVIRATSRITRSWLSHRT